MTTADLIAELARRDPSGKNEVFSECPETGGSWSLESVVTVGNATILRIDSLCGPVAPDSDDT